MSVVIETTLGDITVDLYLNDRPRACLNFLKLCKLKYYNYNLFHTISRGFIAQTGDPTGSRSGGSSMYGLLDGPNKRYFEAEDEPRIKHTKMGLISFVGNEDHMIGSQFFFTLGEDLIYLDQKHCVFGEVVEGMSVLEEINEVICDNDDCPYQDVRITHTVILSDPFPDPKRLVVPSRSPSPSAERLQGGRIAPDEEIDETEGKTVQQIAEEQAEREAKARATILEMVGDLPDADMAPPENVLFVCKLNPVTSDDDLEIIFNRFGKIVSCEVIRDRKTGDSLQYAFIEFAERKSCEDAYFKMDNILIDDRRIHVDFSQSVSKVKWLGKGRGVAHFDDNGRSTNKSNNDIGKGNYKTRRKSPKRNNQNQSFSNSTHSRDRNRRDKSRTPTRYTNKENSSHKSSDTNQVSIREDKNRAKKSGRDRRHRSRSRSVSRSESRRQSRDRERNRYEYHDRDRSRRDNGVRKEHTRSEKSDRDQKKHRDYYRSKKNYSSDSETDRKQRNKSKYDHMIEKNSKKFSKQKKESTSDRYSNEKRSNKKTDQKRSKNDDTSDSDSSDSEDLKKRKKTNVKSKKSKTVSTESSSSDSSDSSSTEEYRKKKKKYYKKK
ncbi:peptidyl-prolyl cis-trans isomerase sig-7 [Diabrotica virgifera virgifera]|uniref:Peptidyl-prolyl cis-trans isomerase n=1 Tax=Diabrotica virgifera virgifera TaxID=50390 RepID=A0ABM5ILY7_DIAVI|nr:peptidyl-prolyl cis-trans isomerase sig-7 [Diabrotica virgifera virgifera]